MRIHTQLEGTKIKKT